jgi:hypothetical protein
MALRDQPYIPLYVQDFLTDEKLNECSASANGILIRLICLMHKSEKYGNILLNQKDKQSPNPLENFAKKLLKHFPFSYNEILNGLIELSEQGVIEYTEMEIWQKRMVRDNEISLKRAEAGSIGGKKTQFAKAKHQANSEYENEYKVEGVNKKKKRFKTPTIGEIGSYCTERGNQIDPEIFFNYYESNGWHVGKNAMKDWKACIRTWEKNNFQNGKAKQKVDSAIPTKESGCRVVGIS